MNKEKIIAALTLFVFFACLLGPLAALVHDGRNAFAGLVLVLGAFGYPVVGGCIKTLTGK